MSALCHVHVHDGMYAGQRSRPANTCCHVRAHCHGTSPHLGQSHGSMQAPKFFAELEHDAVQASGPSIAPVTLTATHATPHDPDLTVSNKRRNGAAQHEVASEQHDGHGSTAGTPWGAQGAGGDIRNICINNSTININITENAHNTVGRCASLHCKLASAHGQLMA